MKDIIVIVGPTGVGKTKLSVDVAKEIGAEIINGDSVSIYKKLDIGSAKPSIEEMGGICHHLIDIRNVDEDYSVFDYQRDAREKINDIISRGKKVIIVGGTGLYIKAALYDYKFDTTNTFNNYDGLTNEEIINKLYKYTDNISVHVNNRRRLVRLLNKYENGEEITNNKDLLLYDASFIGLTTNRDLLYERINKRVDLMIDNGLIDEVKSLKDNYSNSRILNSAIGYKEFSDYLFNNGSIDSVVNLIKCNSRRYAKRQYTFFKNQFDVKWFDVDFKDFNNTINEVLEYINKD